jgi:hypothetical protein
MRTFRPLGPSVVATALASVSTPFSRPARASTPNFSSCKRVAVRCKQFQADGHPIEPGASGQGRTRLLTLCANRSCWERAPGRYFAAAAAAEDRARLVNARCILTERLLVLGASPTKERGIRDSNVEVCLLDKPRRKKSSEARWSSAGWRSSKKIIGVSWQGWFDWR